MTKQFEMNVPDDIRKEFLTQCGYYSEVTPGFVDTIKYANLCATWGANQEYEAAHQYILGAVGEGNARIYQEKRRPRILTEKEKAIEALNYIDEMAICNLTNYTCIDDLGRHRNFLYKIIESLPDDDT